MSKWGGGEGEEKNFDMVCSFFCSQGERSIVASLWSEAKLAYFKPLYFLKEGLQYFLCYINLARSKEIITLILLVVSCFVRLVRAAEVQHKYMEEGPGEVSPDYSYPQKKGCLQGCVVWVWHRPHTTQNLAATATCFRVLCSFYFNNEVARLYRNHCLHWVEKPTLT